jgi:hypothetical protein
MHFSESGGLFTVTQAPSAGAPTAAPHNGADVAQEFKLFLDLNAETHSAITKDLMGKWKATQREKSAATRRRAVDFSVPTFIVSHEVSPSAPASPVLATPASPASPMVPPASIPQAHPVDFVPNFDIRDSVADNRVSLISPERVIGPTEVGSTSLIQLI